MLSTQPRERSCGRAATRSLRWRTTAAYPRARASCISGHTMAPFTHLAFLWSTSARVSAWLFVLTLALFPYASRAELPDGPGKAETEKLCKQCHELERAVSLHQDREGWQATLKKMVTLGTKGTDKEFEAVFEYLVKTFPAEEVPRINVNTARAIEFESGLS